VKEIELASTSKKTGSFSLRAYQVDAKTLPAFNLDKKSTKNLAGFTIQCQPEGQQPISIQSTLQLKTPGDHTQDAKEPATSSVSDDNGPVKVLTGSTNFSGTGIYVNANNVIVFNDPQVAAAHSDVFDTVFKPVSTKLPPPFNQVPGIGLGHQVHHKFVVCGFNGSDPVVYRGSSNLASGGEQANGDNLLAIHDGDVATAFAIEALGLVDHLNFLDKFAKAPNAPKNAKVRPPALQAQAAASAGWFLATTDKWVAPYFNPNDLHFMDRQLFA
jgi:hypothetical protein